MQFLWKYVDDLVGKGLEWYIIVKLLFYASASLIPLALPLSILLSSMMTFGSMSENYELMAFKSAGVSFFKVVKPLLVFIILVSIGAFFFSNTVIPRANLKFGSLLWDVRKQKPALDIKEGIFYKQIDKYSIRIGEKKEEKNVIKDILIYDHTDNNGNNIVMQADHGKMYATKNEQWLIMELYQGVRYEELTNLEQKDPSYPHNRMKFDKYVMRFDLSGFKLTRTKESLFKDHHEMLNISQLNDFIDSASGKLNKKRSKMEQYLAPYFTYIRDSAFFQQKGMPLEVQGDQLINEFEQKDQKELVKNATNMARSVKGALEVHAGEIKNMKNNLVDYQIQWHRKYTLSFACLILFLIGAPMGAAIKKGGLGMPTVVSVVFFIFFHVLWISGEKFSEEFVMPPWRGMWLPVFILLPIGILLTYLSNKDSVILSKGPYMQFFGFIASLFKRKNQ